jgi:hypothetical protein
MSDDIPVRDPSGQALVCDQAATRLDPSGFDPSRMSKDEKSFLLYAESCAVDQGGLLVGARMNADDHAAAKLFCDRGLMFFGRIPAALLKGGLTAETHYVELTLAGWELAWKLRRARADRKGPYATSVWQHEKTLERLAQAMSAGTAETPKVAQGEARQRGPKDAPDTQGLTLTRTGGIDDGE